MPEGHTIHRLARDHTADLLGGPVRVTSPQGRFEAGAALLDGSTIERIEAYGKHLFYRWSDDRVLHIHLGLFGKFHRNAPRPTSRVRMTRGDITVEVTGPTDCSVGTSADRDRIVARLGPDPLRRDGRPDRFVERAGRSRRAIGLQLLDQAVVAGVGNVYRAEALFVHGIHPLRPGTSIDGDELVALWETLRAMLRRGVRDNRIITVDPAVLGTTRGRLRRATWIYRQEHCLRCGTPVDRWDLSGRWAYACPRCQPL